MSTHPTYPDLFELAKTSFHSLIQEFAAYGLAADPQMALQRATGALCYYNLQDGQIYLWLPSLDTPMEELKTRMLASLLGCPDLDEFFHFYRLFIPYLIAHELGHAFRHCYGLFSANLWHEEQVANQLATAVIKHRLPPAEKTFVVGVLRRALQGPAAQVEPARLAVLSYHNVLDALNVIGQIDDADREILHVLQKLVSLSAEDLLHSHNPRTASVPAHLAQRGATIAAINAEYAANYLQYTYCHIGWLYLELTSRTTRFVDEFARVHLNRQVPLLPPTHIPERTQRPTAYEHPWAGSAMASKKISRNEYQRLWKRQILTLCCQAGSLRPCRRSSECSQNAIPRSPPGWSKLWRASGG